MKTDVLRDFSTENWVVPGLAQSREPGPMTLYTTHQYIELPNQMFPEETIFELI